MSRFADHLARHRWPLFVLPLVLAGIPLVAVSPEGGGSRVAIAVLAAGLLGFVFLLGLNLLGRDPDADARALAVVPDPVGAALLARWLRRSKHFRFVGGLVGAIAGLSFLDGDLMPVIVSMLAGIAVGGGLAEVHSLRRHGSDARSADISVRRVGDYAARTDLVALVAIGCGALCLSLVALVADTDSRIPVLAAGLGALATVAAVMALQWLVVVRPRPALSEDLRRADDLMRRLAATQGFTRPAIALAIVLLARSLANFGTGTGYTVVGLLLWILALAWYVSSRQSRAGLMALSRS